MIEGAWANVLDYGAVGDGVTNDSAAIQAAINASPNVYFPVGVYCCNVTINSFFTWAGDGMKVSVLKPFTTSTPCVTNLYEEPDYRFPSMTDIGFQSASQLGIGFCFGNPTAYTTGMELAGRVIFNRCGWQYFNKGVYKPYGNIGNTFNNCSFQWNNYGYFAQSNNILNPSAPIMHAGADTFNQGEAHQNNIAAFCILDNQYGDGGTAWNNVIIEYNPGFGIFIDSGALTTPFLGYTFNNPWLEGNATSATVTIQTISGLQTIAPKRIQVLTSALNYVYSVLGVDGYNGINTLNPQAPLGIWRNDAIGLNLIGGGYSPDWAGIGFSSLGTENISGASIQCYKQTGNDRNMTFTVGSYTSLALDTNGSVRIGNAAVSASIPADGSHLLYGNNNTVGAKILAIGAIGAVPVRFYVSDSDLSNTTSTAMQIGKVNTTGRSINAGGTINASGSDYAEYMVKAGDFIINKGDICGIDANGKLTNVFANAISFVVKSTNPGLVGGDDWHTQAGTEPKEPNPPVRGENESDADWTTTKANYQETLATYNTEITAYKNALEVVRQSVDRIAFCGQVPVNVIGAIAGQYVVPVNDNGKIKGELISNPTFEQYQIAVGKVIAIENDGRARIIVKIT